MIEQELSPQNKKLVADNIGLAKGFASRYCQHPRFDDIRQACYLGLCKAACRWNPGGGASFSTYAKYWMRDAVTQELGNGNGDREILEGLFLNVRGSYIPADEDAFATRDLLLKLLDDLPEEQRFTVLLKYPLDSRSHSYSDEQIGAMLDMSATWVRTLRRRAFGSLRRKLEVLDL